MATIGFRCFAVHAVAALEQENILRRGSDSSSSAGIAVNIKDIGTLEQGKGCVGNPLLAFTIAVDKHLVERSIQGVAGDAVLAFRIDACPHILFRDAAAKDGFSALAIAVVDLNPVRAVTAADREYFRQLNIFPHIEYGVAGIGSQFRCTLSIDV